MSKPTKAKSPEQFYILSKRRWLKRQQPKKVLADKIKAKEEKTGKKIFIEELL